MTTVRLFAAAAEAAGSRERQTDADTLGALIDELVHDDRSRYVLTHCSFLVDGQRLGDLTASVAGATLVDVLPPVAGG